MRGRATSAVLPSSTWGHQTTESTPAELHDKTAERGGGCGRGDDGERRRARSGEAGERDRVGERAGGSGRRERGVEVGGEEAEASRGGGNLILLVDGEAVRRRRAARALGRLNRGRGRATAQGVWAGLLGQLARVG